MMNLVNLMRVTMNYQPRTATDEALLQPAVFAVLQFLGAGKGKFLQDCKNCNCK